MNETKNKIERFVEDIITQKDYPLLDILWIFSYSIPSMSGYHNNSEAFRRWLGKVCIRNLQKKYELNSLEIKEKMKIFINFLNNMPDFLSKEEFYEDVKNLRETIFSKTSEILTQNINNKLNELSDLDRKILSFVLNYIPIRIEDSIKEAEKQKQQYPNSEDKYGFLFDFHIRANNGNINYFEIDPKEWTYIFNLIFDEELKEQRFKAKSYRRNARSIFFPSGQHEEYSFWQFGDELVNIGIGYWEFSLSSTGNITIDFLIPNFIYESIKYFKDKIARPENFENRINEIKKEKENKTSETWNLEEFEETEAISELLESEIESSIISNPDILEEGLELIGNQYPTSVGYIDILCKDKNGFVVVELKRDKGSFKVVGQIQKYMAWVIENLAKGEDVRGIIVVKESDKDLEYAIKGSKFPIQLKAFKQEAPIEENMIHCSNCGKQLQKSAKFCSKCGKEVWM